MEHWKLPGPGLKDWLLLAISVAFVACGLVILPSDLNVGIVTLALFGPCVPLFAYAIYQKRRFARDESLSVEIVGGIPIRPSRLQPLVAGAACLFIGTMLIIFGRSYGLICWGLAWFVALCGAVVLIALATRRLPVGYIQFDPAGITIAHRKWTYLLPWDAISAADAGYYSNNPAILIWLHDLQLAIVTPPDNREKAIRHLAKNAGWVGAPVMLFPSSYGLDLPLLTNAIDRYTTYPLARNELAQRHIESARG